ncbi:restriction endonuclease subunit S [Xylanibacter rarus]|uniref:restriction endonuclease subunit S n=1 Tax=Xylanibacter rarus TaxID=1676614 RepID=UPI003520BE1C
MPFEIPDNWEWCKLGDIVDFQGGYAYKSNTYVNQSDWQVIRIGNVKNDNLVLDTQPVFVEEVIGRETKKYLLQKDDILFTMTGTKGKRDYFYSVKVPSVQKKLLLNQRVGCLRRFSSEVNIDFLCFALKGGYVLDAIFSTETGNVSQGNIGSENTLNLNIAIPPLAEQRRIVSEIERWFSLIDIMENGKQDLQTTIKQAKNKILDLAIHGKLVLQDPNDEPASELLKRINPKAEITCDNAHYPQLPKGWAVAPMQILCSLIDGNKQNGIERVNLDVKYLRGERDPKTLTFGKYIPANSFLILVDGENSGEVFRTPIEGYQGSTFKRLFINENMNTEYMLQVINLYRKLLRENKVGSAIPHLNKKLFKAIEVPIPPYNEQKRIVEAVNFAFKQLDVITESL